MSKENDSTEVENVGNNKAPGKLPMEHVSEQLMVNLSYSIIASEKQVDSVCVCYIMNQGHQKDKNNQSEEVFVVLGANAIIQPCAVMIKA